MNIYENYDGNDINDATFMVESFVEELQLREKLSPKLKALAAAGLIGLSSLGAASCSMPNDPTAYETPAEEETKTPADDDAGNGGDDLNPSDTDPDADDESGAGFNTDATADYVEPKFVFSDEGEKFRPLEGQVELHINEDGFTIDRALIARPTVDSNGTITFYNMSGDVFEDSGIRIGSINTKEPYICFKDGEISFGNSYCYILYDELKAACSENGVRMEYEDFVRLQGDLLNHSKL